MMKLIKIDVKNFGGLSDSEWKISSQLHVFYGPNEAGKSTIAAFIKQIMFGFLPLVLKSFSDDCTNLSRNKSNLINIVL